MTTATMAAEAVRIGPGCATKVLRVHQDQTRQATRHRSLVPRGTIRLEIQASRMAMDRIRTPKTEMATETTTATTAAEVVLIGPVCPTRVLRVRPTIRIHQVHRVQLVHPTTTTRSQALLEIVSRDLRT